MHKLLLSLAIAVLPAISNAGFFGPSNYEDCLLDGMKGVKGDQAARVVAFACRKKFPDKEMVPQPKYEYPERFRFYRFDKDNGWATVTPTSKISLNQIATASHGEDYGSGVKSFDFGYHLTIEVTNRNTFPIDGLYIGLPKNGKSCGADEGDYAETYECSGNAAAGMSGKFRCDIPRIEKRKVSVCTLGFVFPGTRTELNNMKSRNSIP